MRLIGCSLLALTLLNDSASGQEVTWGFDRYEEEGDFRCVASIKNNGFEVGLFRDVGGPIMAFLSGPSMDTTPTHATWSIDGVYSLPLQGSIDDLTGWSYFEITDRTFVQNLMRGRSLNIPEIKSNSFDLIGSDASIENLMRCEAEQSQPMAVVQKRGTAFRGLGLGLSYTEVEAAIAKLGLRCVSASDVAAARLDYDVRYTKSRCLMVARDIKSMADMVSEITITVGYMYENSGMSVVHFDGVDAAALILQASLFNAEKMRPDEFAREISRNYEVDLSVSNIGWTGFSQYGEEISVISDKGVTYVKVTWADGLPTFD